MLPLRVHDAADEALRVGGDLKQEDGALQQRPIWLRSADNQFQQLMPYRVDSHGDVVGADGCDPPGHPPGDVPIVDPDPVLVKVVLEDLRGAVPVEQLDAGLAAQDEDGATVEGAPLGRRDDDDTGGLGPVVHVHLARLRHRIGTDGREDVAAHRAHVYLIPVGVKADDLLRGIIETWGRVEVQYPGTKW